MNMHTRMHACVMHTDQPVSICYADSACTHTIPVHTHHVHHALHTQGEVNAFMEKGLTEEALEPFLFDEEAEKNLTTYEKWQVVRNAAEQVLQVYANRANATWIEEERWGPPNVIDVNAASANGKERAGCGLH